MDSACDACVCFATFVCFALARAFNARYDFGGCGVHSKIRVHAELVFVLGCGLHLLPCVSFFWQPHHIAWSNPHKFVYMYFFFSR